MSCKDTHRPVVLYRQQRHGNSSWKRARVQKRQKCARNKTIRKVAIAIAYRQTKPRNSDADIIRYDRKFPVRSIDRLIKTGRTPGNSLIRGGVALVNDEAEQKICAEAYTSCSWLTKKLAEIGVRDLGRNRVSSLHSSLRDIFFAYFTIFTVCIFLHLYLAFEPHTDIVRIFLTQVSYLFKIIYFSHRNRFYALLRKNVSLSVCKKIRVNCYRCFVCPPSFPPSRPLASYLFQ